MNIKKVRKLFLIGVGGFIVFVVSFLAGYGRLNSGVFSAAREIKTPKGYVIQSGSMEPAIKTASVVVVVPQDSYVPGDIVSFSPNKSSTSTVTHRIIFKQYNSEGVAEYFTAGDANEDFDQGKIKNENIIGKVAFSVPYIGYLVDFAKKPYGFILLVIVPATIVIYEEIRKLLGEIIKKFKGLKGKRPEKKIKLRKDRLPRISAVIPLAGATLIFLGMTGSYFFDREKSQGNLFQASDSFGPPIAQTLVINEVLPDTDCFIGPKEAQWIEVFNGYDVEVNLKDFKITDGVNTVALVKAGNIIISPGSFALLAHDNSVWTQCYEDNGIITANFGTGDLDLDTGILQLLDPGETTIDTAVWDESLPQNSSMEREPDGADTGGPTDFNPDDFEIRPTPFPGT